MADLFRPIFTAPLNIILKHQSKLIDHPTMRAYTKYSKKNFSIASGASILVLSTLLIFTAFVTLADDVYFFTVQGLKLNMQLDEVIKIFQVNNVKSSKDKLGIAHGYEIIKTKDEMKTVLNFTGSKRLYRIDFTNQYPTYQRNSQGILDLLKRKYGEPSNENIEIFEGESRNIRVCWGTTCNRFTPITPALKSTIEWETGKLKLTLVDNRIFNSDWKKYKAAHNAARYGRKKSEETGESSPEF